jgi:hypothetical protein
MYFGKLWWDRHPGCHFLIDRQDACPTNTAVSNSFHGLQSKNTSPELRIGPTKSKLLLRAARPMPLDRMWIGLEIITQMGLLVNNTAS